MSNSKIRIGEIRLKCPGLSRVQAKRLGELVAQGIAQTAFKGNEKREIPSMTVRLITSTDRSVGRLADEILGRIKNGLK